MESEKEKLQRHFGLIPDPTQKLTGEILKFCQRYPHLRKDILNLLLKRLQKPHHGVAEKEAEFSMCNEHNNDKEDSCEQTYTKEPIRSNIKECTNRNGCRDQFQQTVGNDEEEDEEKCEKDLAEKEKCQVDDHQSYQYGEKHEIDSPEKAISELNMLSAGSALQDVCLYSGGMNIFDPLLYSICNNDDEHLGLKTSDKLDSFKAAIYIIYENNICKPSLPGKCQSKNIVEMFTGHDVNTSHNYTATIRLYDSLKPINQPVMVATQTLDLMSSELKLATVTLQAGAEEKPMSQSEALGTDEKNQENFLKSNKKRKMKNKKRFYFKKTESNKKGMIHKMKIGRCCKQAGKIQRKKSRHNRFKAKRDKQKYWILKKIDKSKMWAENARENRRSPQHFGYLFGVWSNNNRNNNSPLPSGPHKVRTHSGVNHSGGGGTGSGRANGGGTSGNSESNGSSSGSQANGGSSGGQTGGNGGPGDDRRRNDQGRSSNSSPSLPNPKLDEKHIAMRETVKRQRGVPPNYSVISTNVVQTGNHMIQAGNPAVQAGNPAVQAGNPAVQAGNPAVQAGNPAAQAGNPAAQAGNPAAQAGNPAAAQAGNPAAQAGNPAAQAGNPAAQAGNPAEPTGADSVQAETIEAMMQGCVQVDYDAVISVQHATLSILQLCDLLGTSTNTIPISSEAVINFNLCLTHALHDLSYSSLLVANDPIFVTISECTACNVLSQILKHLASLTHIQTAHTCDQCSQIFNLILWHATWCISAGRRKARLSRCDLCYKICKSAQWNADMLQTNQWKLLLKVKKYCAKVLGSGAESYESEISPIKQGPEVGIGETDNRFSETEALNLVSSNSSLSFNGNIVTTESSAELQETVPDGPLQSTYYTNTMPPQISLGASSSSSMPGFGSSSTSSIPGFGSSSTSSIPGFGSSSTSSIPGFGSSSTSSIPGFGSLTNMPCPTSASHGDTYVHNKLCRKNSQRRSTSIPQPIAEESGFDEKDSEVPLNGGTKDDFEKFIVGRYSEDPYDTQRTYGEQNRHTSMPLGNVHEPEQFMSLWKYPMGEPGVGAVVFGHPSQLRKVASYWVKKRVECENTGYCPYQHREEGVILAEQKDKFSILRTRYQKNVQWQRLTHLGNGMSGKCHLAMDMKTSFKFCCKKIHLLRYSEEELSLWTEMQHPYIVKLYGAIRHGVKIYIFSEFIDGGDLAACIEEQKRLGRRLSHWSAINYFKQLLQVLAYLQSKDILHEDIKADNILLRQNTKYIAVTDFGTSRKLQDPKELKNKSPVGSPTHWSPEKASMEGHGFPSDLWAAVCVLVHMLSGLPPWLKRYQSAGILNYIIYAQPPPMDDVPQNVQEVVRKLIEKGWVKDPQYRPSPSVLLQDPAFSILNEETPETYYSTLMSHHPVRPGVRPADVNDDHQEHKSMLTTTILTVSPNKTVLYKQHITTSAPQDTQSQQAQPTNDIDENMARQDDHSAGEMIREAQENTENTKQGEDLKSVLQGAMNESVKDPVHPQECKGQPSHEGRQVVDFLSGSGHSGIQNQVAMAQSTERPQLAPRVSELVEPRSIDKLLPDFAELFPDDESENMRSIKSFFVDSYVEGDLKLREKAPLQVYTPEEQITAQYSPEEKQSQQLPILSIFDASIEGSAPANKDDLNDTPTTTGVVTQVSTAACLLTNSIFTLSSDSECASSELFDTVPSVPLDESDKFSQVQNVEDENDLSGACALTIAHTTNLMQRKPINLKLDLNCPPMSRSASPSGNSSLTSGGGDSKRSSAGILTASPPRYSSHQPSPGSGQSTGAIQRQSTHSGSTSSLVQSFLQTSVTEEQKRILLEYSVSTDATLPGINDDDDSVVDTGYNANINVDETQQDDATEDVLSMLRNELDDTTLDGVKLEFYDHSNEKLFEIRVAESPIFLKYIIEIARNKIKQCQYIHFTFCYLNGALLDFFRPISTQQLKVVQLTDPADKCLCGQCPAIF
ncbi:unnamed protein product [Lymnaea stagnalis]|uniref:non-specific serine/threonine protein kinase n=1 Tax=Lymnaea stagnalis TaxID=6523 RepID=A0AAV2HKR6_LYMST